MSVRHMDRMAVLSDEAALYEAFERSDLRGRYVSLDQYREDIGEARDEIRRWRICAERHQERFDAAGILLFAALGLLVTQAFCDVPIRAAAALVLVCVAFGSIGFGVRFERKEAARNGR